MEASGSVHPVSLSGSHTFTISGSQNPSPSDSSSLHGSQEDLSPNSDPLVRYFTDGTEKSLDAILQSIWQQCQTVSMDTTPKTRLLRASLLLGLYPLNILEIASRRETRMNFENLANLALQYPEIKPLADAVQDLHQKAVEEGEKKTFETLKEWAKGDTPKPESNPKDFKAEKYLMGRITEWANALEIASEHYKALGLVQDPFPFTNEMTNLYRHLFEFYEKKADLTPIQLKWLTDCVNAAKDVPACVRTSHQNIRDRILPPTVRNWLATLDSGKSLSKALLASRILQRFATGDTALLRPTAERNRLLLGLRFATPHGELFEAARRFCQALESEFSFGSDDSCARLEAKTRKERVLALIFELAKKEENKDLLRHPRASESLRDTIRYSKRLGHEIALKGLLAEKALQSAESRQAPGLNPASRTASLGSALSYDSGTESGQDLGVDSFPGSPHPGDLGESSDSLSCDSELSELLAPDQDPSESKGSKRDSSSLTVTYSPLRTRANRASPKTRPVSPHRKAVAGGRQKSDRRVSPKDAPLFSWEGLPSRSRELRKVAAAFAHTLQALLLSKMKEVNLGDFHRDLAEPEDRSHALAQYNDIRCRLPYVFAHALLFCSTEEQAKRVVDLLCLVKMHFVKKPFYEGLALINEALSNLAVSRLEKCFLKKRALYRNACDEDDPLKTLLMNHFNTSLRQSFNEALRARKPLPCYIPELKSQFLKAKENFTAFTERGYLCKDSIGLAGKAVENLAKALDGVMESWLTVCRSKGESRGGEFKRAILAVLGRGLDSVSMNNLKDREDELWKRSTSLRPEGREELSWCAPTTCDLMQKKDSKQDLLTASFPVEEGSGFASLNLSLDLSSITRGSSTDSTQDE